MAPLDDASRSMQEEAEVASPLTAEELHAGVDAVLHEESWDTLTLKLVMARLEQRLLPQHPPGTLKPQKKVIKGVVDTLMKQMLDAGYTGPTAAAGPSQPAPAAEPAPAPPQPTDEAPPAPSPDAPPAKRQRAEPEAAPVAEADAADADAPADAADAPAADDDADAPAAADDAPAGPAEDDDDDDELSDDPDAPRVQGKPTHKLDGKLFYKKMLKGDEELRIGQDVYLENGQEIPYVARLQEIFVYSFAPSEVYFNARWYYRVADVHEYARMEGAKADVEFEGRELSARAKELFFSLHMDENHADCILRQCSVHLLQTDDEPPESSWDVVGASQHEYAAWRAYDKKRVYALTELPSKKLKDACDLEARRGPRQPAALRAERSARLDPQDVLPTGPLHNDELRAVGLPRKHLEVWLDTPSFTRVVTGTLVRVSQLINGNRTFYAAYVVGVKRAPRPYKLGPKIAEVALQVRTQTGSRLIGLDALSNEPTSDGELAKFRVPLDPETVRKKLRSLQRAMQEESGLFEEEELKRRVEMDERLREKREEEARAKMLEEEERERKERERDEVRRRAAANKPDTEAWWLKYNNKAGDKQREIAKLKARLGRFRKIAASSTADGERENAQRLAEQAEEKLQRLTAEEVDAAGAGAPAGAAPAPAPAEPAPAAEADDEALEDA